MSGRSGLFVQAAAAPAPIIARKARRVKTAPVSAGAPRSTELPAAVPIGPFSQCAQGRPRSASLRDQACEGPGTHLGLVVKMGVPAGRAGVRSGAQLDAEQA